MSGFTEDLMESTTEEALETTTFIPEEEIITPFSPGAFIGYGILIGCVLSLAVLGLVKGWKKYRRAIEYNSLA